MTDRTPEALADREALWKIIDHERRGWTRIGSGDSMDLSDAIIAAGWAPPAALDSLAEDKRARDLRFITERAEAWVAYYKPGMGSNESRAFKAGYAAAEAESAALRQQIEDERQQFAKVYALNTGEIVALRQQITDALEALKDTRGPLVVAWRAGVVILEAAPAPPNIVSPSEIDVPPCSEDDE